MSSNPENRNKTRFAHESKVMLESTEIGFRRDARMFNFSDIGIYFESDFRLRPESEIFVGISDSPFAPQPDIYERYLTVVRWRQKLKRSSYFYGYGVEIIGEASKTPELHSQDGTRVHPRKDAAIQVKYEFENETYAGVTENVSSGGAFIRSDYPMSIGQNVRLWIPLKKSGRIARLTGQVARTNLRGFGVKFIKSK